MTNPSVNDRSPQPSAVDMIRRGWVIVPTSTREPKPLSPKDQLEARPRPNKHPGVKAGAAGLTVAQAEHLARNGAPNRYNMIIGSKDHPNRCGIVDIETDGPIGEKLLTEACGGTIPAGPYFATASGSVHRLFTWPGVPDGKRVKMGKALLGPESKVDMMWQNLVLDGDTRVWHDFDLVVPDLPAGLPDAVVVDGRMSGTVDFGDIAGPGETTPYGLAALGEECEILAGTRGGGRSEQLFQSSMKLGHLVTGMELALDDLIDGIGEACVENGHDDDYPGDWVRQMENGVEVGAAEPKSAPVNELRRFFIDQHGEKVPFMSLDAIGVSDRFVAQHGGKVRYIADMGLWLVWDGKRWQPDAKHGTIQELAKQTVVGLHDEAAAALMAGESDLHKAITSLVRPLAQRIGLVHQLAASSAAVQRRGDQLDADPYLLNCQNGTVDLRTGELRPHDPGDLITKITAGDYVPGLDSAWQTFLDDVQPDKEMQGYLRRLMGYTLIGGVTEHRMPFLEGPPRSGKSTFVESCAGAVGDYAVTASVELFLHGGKATYELAKLRGARLISMAEFDEHARINVSLVKQVTGGDTVPAREIYGSPFQFRPQGTIWVSTNHMPWVGADEAAWVRVRRVPFTVSFIGREDTALPGRLVQDPGVLAWIVAGALEYQRDGLTEPMGVTLATDEVKQTQDPVARFIDEECQQVEGHEASAGDLYGLFGVWCARNGEKAISSNRFGRRLTGLGYSSRKTNGVLVRKGLLPRHQTLRDAL